MRRRPRNPRRFLRAGRAPGTRTLVVCAGDSITHGIGSFDYVSRLRSDTHSAGFEFVNAGWSGDLAWNLLDRLDEVIACRPDVVTVLIGTNDAASQIDDTWRDSYMKRQRLPRHPDLGWYRETLEKIVRRLQAETTATVALLDLPPLGEDLDSRFNRIVDDHNTAIRTVADTTGVPVLPLHARLLAALPAGHQPPRFDGTKRLMVRAIVSRFIRRRSWNDIARRNGLALLTDNVHLDDRAGSVVTGLIEEFLSTSTSRKDIS